ncbi:MAG: LPXTG cell wall anchor domain-containing protein [Bacilli bacterium]|jgi:LPXTG-motif cell wall-anchored protein|nr:LPXTG cell wall anchor domain-containing protein [Bacilli bacterium]
MKKFKSYFAFIFMALILCTTNVYAVSKMVITDKSYIRTNFSDGTYRNEAYFTTNKGVAYCITPSKKGGPQGSSLNYSETVNSGSVLYLLSHAGNTKNERLITQLAIWKVNNNFIPAAYNKNTTIVNAVNNLANTAKNNSNYSVNPTIKLSSSTLSFSESSDGNYYVSNNITVSHDNMSEIVATVAGAKDATLISSNKSGSSLSLVNGSNFSVRIPKDNISSTTDIKVVVKGTGTKLSYERYSGGKWQDLIILVKTPITVNLEANGKVTPVVHKCEYKYGKYYDKDGKVTDENGYNLQCKTHTCDKINDKFFGKDGNEVTEDEYNLQCKTHTCEIVGNKYFDKDGNETDANTYKQQCEMVIEVPNTGSSDNLVFTVLGIITITGVVLMIKKF